MTAHEIVQTTDSQSYFGRIPAAIKRALSWTDVRGAYLVGVDLECALMQGTILIAADLSDAKLGYADMCAADLRRADLRRADMHNAKLCGADLRNADLRDANMTGAWLAGAMFEGPDGPVTIGASGAP